MNKIKQYLIRRKWRLIGCKIDRTAIIHPNVVLSKGVEVGAYSVIGGAAEIKGQKQEVKGIVFIGENSVIREHVTIHSPRTENGSTYIGSNGYIQAHAHIGHDSQISDNVTIACFACVGGHNELRMYANLGLHVVTHPHTIVGGGTIIGCNSFAKGELDSWSVYVGSPAKRIKANNHLRNKLGLREL